MTSAAPQRSGFSSHRPAQRPRLHGAGRRDHPAGRHPPGHRPALRLQGRRLRLLQVQEASGEVTLDPHQSKALCAEEEAAGFVLTCCAHAAERRGARVAPGHRSRRLPDPQDAGARARPGPAVARRDACCACSCRPASRCSTMPASTSSSSCATATRRSYSMANAPHTLGEPGTGIELHIRHMPGGKFTDHVFSAMKEKEILRVEGPYGSFFLREDSDKPIVLLASGTGFAPIKALIEHMQFKGIDAARHAVLGRPPARRPVHGRLGAGAAGGDAQPALRAGGLQRGARRQLDRPHRLRAPGRAGRLRRPVGPPGLCLRRADRGRLGHAHDYVARAGLPEEEFFADAFTTEADKALP